MSSTLSCKQCGCSEIDTDPARGDAVCTSCGFVLEESIIVSEVTFEEDGRGGASAIGQFVSAESRGGGGLSSVGGSGFHINIAKESREVTIRNAKKKITELAQQLRLNQHCIDVACNFFKMALHKQLTKGRKHSLTIAACIYMTCRMEGTPHLLIDFSDALQIDVYALGRAYVQISRALYINIPAVDPCMYILRFAHKFELGEKTHDVAMTALRLVQRMKRDWIHLGRRPSGLCGAALLISARLHQFSRSVHDVIRVVKVHETTLRKRLVEFGETPSSSLTLDEFMSVDLEEEHDPPSFKAARIRDRERLQKLLDADVGEEFKVLQNKIDEELDKRRKRLLSKSAAASPNPSLGETDDIMCSPIAFNEGDDEHRFIQESTMKTIKSIISDDEPKSPVDGEYLTAHPEDKGSQDLDRILMPPPATASAVSISHSSSTDNTTTTPKDSEKQIVPVGQHEEPKKNEEQAVALVEGEEDGELDLDGIDDNEINGYIMSQNEVVKKTVLWERLNADYITLQRLKQEQLARDILEGKVDKKKKKKAAKAKPTFQAKSANEAIKIMLKERKVSSKINYDVLRSLTAAVDLADESPLSHLTDPHPVPVTVIESGPIIPRGNKRKMEAVEPAVPSTSKKSKIKNNRRQSVSENNDASCDTKEKQEPRQIPKKEKKPNIELIPEAKQTLPSIEDEPAVVIESGPVRLDAKGEIVVESGKVQYAHAHEHDEDEEDEDEDEALSARRLLTQFRGEEENEDEEYY